MAAVPQEESEQGADLDLISGHLRENIHDINNALFVTKGFVEELSEELKRLESRADESERKLLKEMFDALSRNVTKLDSSIQNLRMFAKHGIYEEPFCRAGARAAPASSAERGSRQLKIKGYCSDFRRGAKGSEPPPGSVAVSSVAPQRRECDGKEKDKNA